MSVNSPHLTGKKLNLALMKKLIIILSFCSVSSLMLAQSVEKTIEIKPISLHLYEQKVPFQNNTIISPWNVAGYMPIIKNHPYGDYSYNYLNPHNSQYPAESLFVGLANYFLDNTVNRK